MTESRAERPNTTTKTVGKALHLLALFSPEKAEYGVSDLARAAKMDKATTIRILASLMAGGLIEQHPETKRYRLGIAVLHLARIREASFPMIAVLQPILEKLTLEVGESTHACLFSGRHMITITIAEPHRSTRVFIDPAQPLPVHATASGQVFLAYADQAAVNDVFKQLNELKVYTEKTVRSEDELRRRLDDIRKSGCAKSSHSFEEEVTGIAAPIFDWHGKIQATIAAACVSTRMTPELECEIENAVLRASVAASRAMGGEPPKTLSRKIWENS